MKHQARERAQRSAGPRVEANPTGPLARLCPTCDAAPGFRCVVWRMDKGERLYILRRMPGFHKERRQARG